MVYTLILATLLLPNLIASAQTTPSVWGARAAALGNCSTFTADGASLLNNPATLQSQRSSAWFFYEARPALTGADRMSAVAMGNLFSGTLAAGIFRFGDDLYNEQQLAVAFGHSIGSTSLGLSATLWQQSTPTGLHMSDISLSFGGITSIGTAIRTGAFITNLNQAICVNEMLPVRMIAGIACRMSDQLEIMTEVDKDIDFEAQYRFGIEYNHRKRIFFRSGFNWYPAIATFGMGAVVNRLTIDCSFQSSSHLGAAIQTAASWKFRPAIPQ